MSYRSIDDIAVAHTPPGGWTEWPEPILASCNSPLVDGAPDLRGTWRTIEVSIGGQLQADHPGLGHVQRIEQAGDRLVVTAAGIIHDMRCDGTAERGVHDVAEFDKVTEIHVMATYEREVHVLRPQGMPIEIKRWRDGDHLMWQYLGYTARLERISEAVAHAR